MSRTLHNYLRTYRKRSGLSQKEMAFLLGSTSAAKVSRYERLKRAPNPETIFAYQIIFGAAPSELFAGMVEKVEQKVKRRARMLAARLEKQPHSRRCTKKLEFLKGITTKHSSEPDNTS